MEGKGENSDTLPVKKEDGCDDSSYFRSYADLDVHELMLKDKPRTLAYKQFIERNKQVFVDKVIIDVGAGTGILSLFAAAAGAKQVFAIEASEIASACEAIVQQNGYEDQITVIHQRVEDVVLPSGVKADILISEWMGFYLLHESMLDSVIYARDNLLRENGLILPSHAKMFLCPVNMADIYLDKFEFWKDVYGFDYTPLIPSIIVKSLQSPSIGTVSPEDCLCSAKEVISLDLSTVSLDEVKSFQKDFSFVMTKNATVHGFVSWFDVEFVSQLSNETDSKNSILSTSPFSPPTHWKQTIFNLPAPLLVDSDDVVKCRIELSQDEKNKRHYNISIELLEMPECAEISDGKCNDIGDCGDESSEDEDVSDHPTPCDCDHPRCKIIKALIEKYDEQDEMMKSEGVVDITSEELDEAIDISDNFDP